MNTSSVSASATKLSPTFSNLVEPLTIIVEGRPSSGGMGLTTAIGYLDSQLRTQGELYPGDLRHYLQRRSYAKALEFIRQPTRRHSA